MARSFEYYKKDVAEYLKTMFPRGCTVLDVGAGEGTYYDLLGDYFKTMDAVEIFEPNIDNYGLKEKYRNVYNVDIRDFKYNFYDIIIFGDVLEHLEVPDAQKVLKYALERSRQVLVAVPYMYEQGEEEGNVHEIHLQADLTPEIIKARYPQLKLLIGNKEYGYYIKNNEFDKIK